MVKVWPTATLPDVLIVETRVFEDTRGFFHEIYQQKSYTQAGIRCDFVQDNMSVSCKNVIRGLHLQHPSGQDKLVNVFSGEIFDVVVDVRRGSPTFGKWAGEVLSAKNHRQLFVPKGFAHGFCSLTDDCAVAYKCSDFYNPTAEISILWNDEALGIEWPVKDPVLSDKDKIAPKLADLKGESLPMYQAPDGESTPSTVSG